MSVCAFSTLNENENNKKESVAYLSDFFTSKVVDLVSS